MSPRIAIIGAGPGGLTLACILARHSIIPTVFERDPSADYRPQGGTLDLHTNSGQQALRDAGLWDEFLKHARYEAQVMKIMVKSGNILFQDGPGDSEGEPGEDNGEETRPEIDRTALRNILLNSFGTNNVNWSHTLTSVEPAANNKFDLHFKGGKVETGFDLVVGADGAWSRVRPSITTVTPSYSGVSTVEFNIADPTDSRYDAVNEFVGKGSAFTFSDQKSLTAQRLGTNGIRIYAGFGMDEVKSDWLSTHFDVNDPAGTKEKVLSYYSDWSPLHQEVIHLADEDDSLLLRPLYVLPVDHTWEARPGLTLLGDAAHLMTPYAGEGVNITMWDSLELAKKIVEGIKSGDLNGAVREYELDMFKRGSDSMRRTDTNKRAFFSKDFPNSMLEVMRAMRGEGLDSQ